MNFRLRLIPVLWIMTVVVIGLGAWSSTRLQLSENISDMLPQDNLEVAKYKLLVDHFQYANGILVDFSAVQNSSTSDDGLAKAGDAFYQSAQESGLFQDVLYRFDPAALRPLIAKLNAHLPFLLDTESIQRLDALLQPERIAARFSEFQKSLQNPEGFIALDQFRRDPVGVEPILMEKMKWLQDQTGKSVEIVQGRMWNKNHDHLLLVAFPKSRHLGGAESVRIAAFLRNTRASILRENTHPGVSIHILGAPLIATDNAEVIKSDIRHTLIAANIGIALIGLLLFRHKWFIWLMFIPPVVGANVAILFCSLVAPTISGIALGFGAALLGITVDHSIMVLCLRDTGTRLTEAQIRRTLWGPLFLCAITTVGAFLGIMFSNMPGLRQMGLFSALATCATALYTLFVFPYLVGLKEDSTSMVSSGISPLDRLYEFVTQQLRPFFLQMALGGVVLAILAFAGTLRLHFTGEVTALNHLSPSTASDRDVIVTSWNLKTPSFIIVRGQTLEAALQENDLLFQNLLRQKSVGAILSFSSIAPVVPSEKTQNEHLQDWAKFWTPTKQSAVEKSGHVSSQSIGLKSNALSSWINELEHRPDPVKLTDFSGTVIGSQIGQRISEGKSETLILSSAQVSPTYDVSLLSREILKGLSNGVWIDNQTVSKSLGVSFKEQMWLIWIMAFLIVGIFLWIFLGRLELVLIAYIPVFVSTLLVLGTLGWLGIPLTPANSLFMILLLGVGTDFSIVILNIEMTALYAKHRDNRDLFKSTTICALTSLVGFGAMAISQHPVLRHIGITGVAGVGANFIASVIMVPAMVRFLIPNNGIHGVVTIRRFFCGLVGFGWFWIAILIYSLIRPIMLLRARGCRQRLGVQARRFIYSMARGLLLHYPFIRFRIDTSDPVNGALDEPCIVVCNHSSTFDIPVAAMISPNLALTVKGWVWRIPLIGTLLRDAEYIPVQGDDYDAILKEVREHIVKGVSVLIFPEGTRSRDGHIKRFHTGAFQLAKDSKSQLLPVLLSNTQRCIPWGSYWVQDAKASIRFFPKTTAGTATAREKAQAVRQVLNGKVEEDWTCCQNDPSFYAYILQLYRYLDSSLERSVNCRLSLDPLYQALPSLVPEQGAIHIMRDPYGLISTLLGVQARRRVVTGFGVCEDTPIMMRNRLALYPNVKLKSEDYSIPRDDIAEFVFADCGHYANDELESIFAGASEHLVDEGLLLLRYRSDSDRNSCAYKYRSLLIPELRHSVNLTTLASMAEKHNFVSVEPIPGYAWLIIFLKQNKT